MRDIAAFLSPFLLSMGAALLLYAAFHDWVARTVPNAVSGVLAIVGLIARFLAGDWVWGVAGAAIVFVLCAFCWRRGWMGGADVKLLGAASLAVPAVAIVPFVLATTISGAILATLYLMGGAWARAYHRSHPTARTRPIGLIARAIRVELRRLRRGGPLPYACAIAVGYLFVVHHGV